MLVQFLLVFDLLFILFRIALTSSAGKELSLCLFIGVDFSAVLVLRVPFPVGVCVKHIYPSELQLNKTNSSDTEAQFLELHLTISDGFVSSKMTDKGDDFDFDIVNCPFLVGDIPSATSYSVYISQLIRFARVSSHVAGFKTRNQITAKLLKQGYRYQNSVKRFQNSI